MPVLFPTFEYWHFFRMALNQLSNYRIPQGDFYVVSFSGGKTSGYMLRNILDANNGIPSNAQVVFCNTGKEREETLEFVNQCALNWNVDIAWLEYDYVPTSHPRHIARRVDYKTASRQGEPFEIMVRAKKHLPNVVTRICTGELKVKTVRRYLRSLGIRKHTSIIGFRYDERRRVISKHNDSRLFPLIYDEVQESDVIAYWKTQPFQLGLEGYQGNCDMCFLKGKSKLLALIKQDPDRAKWWIEMEALSQSFQAERKHKIRNPCMLNFNRYYSYQELTDYAKKQPDLPFNQDELGIDCHCTD